MLVEAAKLYSLNQKLLKISILRRPHFVFVWREITLIP